MRVPRARTRQKSRAHFTPETLISQGPPEVANRAVPGHSEGDLLIGLQRSAIGTLVERSSRFTTLVHLPREDGYGVNGRTKNGPTLAGCGAITMANALKQTITTLPAELRQPLTWDLCQQLSAQQFSIASRVKVYFADPKSAWQCGINENTNGLLRQYFPKRTDLSRWNADDIAAIAHTLNTRPRKTLGWQPLRSLRRPPTRASSSRRCDHRLNPAPVHLMAVRAPAPRGWTAGLDGAGGLSVRQRCDRIVLRLDADRACSTAAPDRAGRVGDGDLRIHRGLLQPRAPPQRSGLPQPHRLLKTQHLHQHGGVNTQQKPSGKPGTSQGHAMIQATHRGGHPATAEQSPSTATSRY